MSHLHTFGARVRARRRDEGVLGFEEADARSGRQPAWRRFASGPRARFVAWGPRPPSRAGGNPPGCVNRARGTTSDRGGRPHRGRFGICSETRRDTHRCPPGCILTPGRSVWPGHWEPRGWGPAQCPPAQWGQERACAFRGILPLLRGPGWRAVAVRAVVSGRVGLGPSPSRLGSRPHLVLAARRRQQRRARARARSFVRGSAHLWGGIACRASLDGVRGISARSPRPTSSSPLPGPNGQLRRRHGRLRRYSGAFGLRRVWLGR